MTTPVKPAAKPARPHFSSGPCAKRPGWTPENLTLDSLAPVIQLHPEVLVLATGTRSVFPRAQLRAEIGGRGIGLEVMDIGAACRTFNVLVSEGRRAVIAVLFP